MSSTLSAILERILQRYLKPYFDGVDDGEVSLSVWKGEAVIGDLEIKKDFMGTMGITQKCFFVHLKNIFWKHEKLKNVF